MSADQNIYTSVANLLLEKLHLHIPGIDIDLVETGLLDSLAFVELTVQLEETFGITIPMERLHIDNVRSISAIAEFVAMLQSPQKSGTDSAGVLSEDTSSENSAPV
jgi:acyl carrier protein